MEKFKVICLFCGEIDKIQTTMERDSGYSNWTVMDSGYIEFKCHSCGTFGSNDYNKKNVGSNKLDKFELICNKCNHHFKPEEGFSCGDCDCKDDQEITCPNCKETEIFD